MSNPIQTSHFFLALTFCLGCIALYPSINTQGFLASGDHGRDLYAFERTLHGDVPYQDYWWVYGPIMPYYYAVFDHFAGVNIQSILIGKGLLTLTSGILIYFTLETLAGGLAAFAGAAWFFAFGHDFFFTYNHAGGITCIAFIMLCMAQYLRHRNDDWLWTGIVGAFILSLIKVNFGLLGIIILLLTAWTTDHGIKISSTSRKHSFYIFSAIVLPLIIAGVYWSFLHGLSLKEIRQCMPFSPEDNIYSSNPFQAMDVFLSLFWRNTLTIPSDFTLWIVITICLLRIIYALTNQRINLEQRRNILLILGLFGVYYVLNFHEYLKSGVWYRSFWAQPAGIVWMFALIHLALEKYPKIFRFLIFILLIVLASLHINTAVSLNRQIQASGRYLTLPLGGVFLSNSPEWLQTVEDTTIFLKTNIPSNETFFALPYDPLFYYLTTRKSPTRMLIFFDHLNIPPWQELKTLHELEAAKVNFVVLSNRIKSREMGLGIFGKTYCPIIAKYIDDNFVPAVQFGDWQNEPGWAWNYGTMILKRKVFLK